MIVNVIRTPTDYEATLEAAVCRVNCWLPLPVEEMQGVEPLMEQLFGGRHQLERGMSDGTGRDIDSLAAPLEQLQELGLQLVAILTRGQYVIRGLGTPGPVSIAPVEMADYLVAPDPCYFRRAGAPFEAPIHKLGAPCEAGHELIVNGSDEAEKLFSVWTGWDEVMRDFEMSVPWCSTCRGAERPDERPPGPAVI
jgi:hypothetical protein